MAVPRPKDEQFADSYAEQGIQPTYKNIRNVEKTEKAANDDLDIGQAANASNAYAAPTNRTYNPQVEFSRREIPLPPPKKQTITVKQKKKAVSPALRIRATAVNTGIWSWAWWVYIPQLIFGILSVVFLGVAAVLGEIFSDEIEADDGLGTRIRKFFFKGVKKAFDTLSEALSFATGIDIGNFFETVNPNTAFLLAHTVTFVIGWGTLMVIGLIYTLSRMNSLFGQGSSTKLLTFLLAFIGYAVPLLNLFPWFIFWTMAVWKYPK